MIIGRYSFSNLFGAPLREPLAIGPGNQTLSRNSSPVVAYHGSPALALGSSENQAGLSIGGFDAGGAVCQSPIRSTNQRLSTNSDLIVLMDSDLNMDRGRASSRDGSSRFMNLESSGYIHAYGWSLPVSSFKSLGNGAITSPEQIQAGADCELGSDLGLGSKLSNLGVPIPQYCRPLTGDSSGMKIWCATAIDLNGGELDMFQETGSDTANLTLDPTESSSSLVNITSTPVKAANVSALKQLEEEVHQALNETQSTDGEPSFLGAETSRATNRPTRRTSDGLIQALPQKEELSSCVWICSTQHSRSKITIIDIKTKPNELMDSFHVPTFLYSIKSIPGCKSTDLPGLFVPSADGQAEPENNQPKFSTMGLIEQLIATQKQEFYKFVDVDPYAPSEVPETKRNSLDKQSDEKHEPESVVEKSLEQETREVDDAARKTTSPRQDDISRILDDDTNAGIATLQKLNDFVAHTQPQSGESSEEPLHSTPIKSQDGTSGERALRTDGYQSISTHLPTVWMGGKNSVLYVHSAIGQWKDYVTAVKLPDSILQIFHFRGRVFVALADGSLCVFFRHTKSKQWNLTNYLLIDIGLMAEITCELMTDLNSPPSTKSRPENDGEPTSLSDQLRDATAKEHEKAIINRSRNKSKVAGIRCLELTNKNLWVGYRNRVLIMDPITLKLKHTFSVVPQLDNQIRQLVAMKDGVFCCLRSDLILRLYSSLKPYQHIQNIDIEPVVTRLLCPRSFVISHITAMKVAENMLWIGNAHGIIITIPCTLVSQVAEAPSRFSNDDADVERPESLSIARFVPKCDINYAQVSEISMVGMSINLERLL